MTAVFERTDIMSDDPVFHITWTRACNLSNLRDYLGVTVLLDDGSHAALFRVGDNLYAIGNIDPYFQASVMSRGIVGDRSGRLMVQSPLKKQAFALDDGTCLDNPAVRLPVYRTRVDTDGTVYVGR